MSNKKYEWIRIKCILDAEVKYINVPFFTQKYRLFSHLVLGLANYYRENKSEDPLSYAWQDIHVGTCNHSNIGRPIIESFVLAIKDRYFNRFQSNVLRELNDLITDVDDSLLIYEREAYAGNWLSRFFDFNDAGTVFHHKNNNILNIVDDPFLRLDVVSPTLVKNKALASNDPNSVNENINKLAVNSPTYSKVSNVIEAAHLFNKIKGVSNV